MTETLDHDVSELLLTVDEWRMLSEGAPAPVLTSSQDASPPRSSSALASLLLRGLAAQTEDGQLVLHPLAGWVSTVCSSATIVIDLARVGEGEPAVIQIVDSSVGRLAATPTGREFVQVAALGQDQRLGDQVSLLCGPVFAEDEVQLYARVWNAGREVFWAIAKSNGAWQRGVQGGSPVPVDDAPSELRAFVDGSVQV